MLTSIIIACLVMGLAIWLYFMLPAIIDFEMSFLWAVGVFLILYIGAAVYLTSVIPPI
jgi:hypothetical protein